jgi:hypothetical protein
MRIEMCHLSAQRLADLSLGAISVEGCFYLALTVN